MNPSRKPSIGQKVTCVEATFASVGVGLATKTGNDCFVLSLTTPDGPLHVAISEAAAGRVADAIAQANAKRRPNPTLSAPHCKPNADDVAPVQIVNVGVVTSPTGDDVYLKIRSTLDAQCIN